MKELLHDYGIWHLVTGVIAILSAGASLIFKILWEKQMLAESLERLKRLVQP